MGVGARRNGRLTENNGFKWRRNEESIWDLRMWLGKEFYILDALQRYEKHENQMKVVPWNWNFQVGYLYVLPLQMSYSVSVPKIMKIGWH